MAIPVPNSRRHTDGQRGGAERAPPHQPRGDRARLGAGGGGSVQRPAPALPQVHFVPWPYPIQWVVSSSLGSMTRQKLKWSRSLNPFCFNSASASSIAV